MKWDLHGFFHSDSNCSTDIHCYDHRLSARRELEQVVTVVLPGGCCFFSADDCDIHVNLLIMFRAQVLTGYVHDY
ncbi:hypothetical protein M758_9G097300 [Ceratodon purpureus]|nr:hypothetical protein M758_9G097300 [Ceratodon purpureus]